MVFRAERKGKIIMDLLEGLKKLCEEHERQLQELRQKINEVDYFPKAKALVGKCFKYPGGASYYAFGIRGRGITKMSYIYKRIIGADKEYVIVDSIHMESPGKIEIIFHEKEYVTHFYNRGLIPITEKQYFTHFNKVSKYIFETGKKEN